MNYLKVFKNHFPDQRTDSSWQLLKTVKCHLKLKCNQQTVTANSSYLAKNLENLIIPLALENIKNKIIEDSKNEIIGIINLLLEKVFLQKSNKKNSFLENQLKELIKNQNKSNILRLELNEAESKNLSPEIKTNFDIQINKELKKCSAVLFSEDRRIEINLQNQIKQLETLLSEAETFSLELKKSIKKLL